MVFSGLYPIEGDDFPDLRDALDRLRLNDAALVYEPESSTALGFGFRCGFLGLLHMDIVRERLEREFGLALITTAPNVAYRVTLETGETIMVSNPSELPPAGSIQRIEEPYVAAMVLCPADYIGPVMELCQSRRGEMTKPDADRVLDHMRALRIRLLGDRVLQSASWRVADRLGWPDTFTAEYIAVTQLQADAFITLDAALADAVKGLVRTAPYEELRPS